MRIGVDAHFLSKIAQGTGTYTYQLIKHLRSSENGDSLFLLNKKDITGLWESGTSINPAFLFSNFSPLNVLLGFWYVSKKYKLDIIHTNYFCSILPGKAKNVLTVHDVLYKSHKEFFPKKLRVGTNLLQWLCLRKADAIIAVSNYTKQQLIKYYPFTAEKINVIYEAASSQFYQIDLNQNELKENIRSLGICKPYILFVGRLARIKNVEKLVNIFITEGLYEKYNLVLVGNYDVAFPYYDLEKKISLNKSIIHLHNIDNEQLNLLYNFATMFYFVSYGEGFGLPILEAMSAGCPVLTSNTTACEEIAGDAAYKVNPDSEEEIFLGISKILNDIDLRNVLRNKGLKRSKDFSWEKCAESTRTLYANLVV